MQQFDLWSTRIASEFLFLLPAPVSLFLTSQLWFTVPPETKPLELAFFKKKEIPARVSHRGLDWHSKKRISGFHRSYFSRKRKSLRYINETEFFFRFFSCLFSSNAAKEKKNTPRVGKKIAMQEGKKERRCSAFFAYILEIFPLTSW